MTIKTNENTTKIESIDLTVSNLEQYIQLDGQFIDGTYSMGGIINRARATLDFQAYPVVSGKFNNVEITLIAKSNANAFTYMNSFGNYWHLAEDDKDTKSIKFSFRLGIDGKYSQKYSVECLNNTGVLAGKSDFELLSVTGTFIPE